MTSEPVENPDLEQAPVPRRWVLRALTGVAVGGVMLVGLAACGGEGGGGGEDEEDEEEDD